MTFQALNHTMIHLCLDFHFGSFPYSQSNFPYILQSFLPHTDTRKFTCNVSSVDNVLAYILIGTYNILIFIYKQSLKFNYREYKLRKTYL